MRNGRGDRQRVDVIVDPHSKEAGLTLPPLSADILAISHDNSEHNNTDAVTGDPFLIREPGEYEVQNVFVEGIPGFHSVTPFLFWMEDLRVAYLPDVGQHELTDEQVERLAGADVLLIPVGGAYTINGKQARDIVRRLTPGFVVPVHYFVDGLSVELAGVDEFLEAMGVSDVESQGKLTVNEKDVPGEDEATEVVVLEAQVGK